MDLQVFDMMKSEESPVTDNDPYGSMVNVNRVAPGSERKDDSFQYVPTMVDYAAKNRQVTKPASVVSSEMLGEEDSRNVIKSVLSGNSKDSVGRNIAMNFFTSAPY